jgi:hypothetical protein
VAELAGHAQDAEQQRRARHQRHRAGDEHGQAVGRQRWVALGAGGGAGGDHGEDCDDGHPGGQAVAEAGGTQLDEFGADRRIMIRLPAGW